MSSTILGSSQLSQAAGTFGPKEAAKLQTIRDAWGAAGISGAEFDRRWASLRPTEQQVWLGSARNSQWMIEGFEQNMWTRRFHQMIDTSAWRQMFVNEGHMSLPSPHWERAMILAGYAVDSGDTGQEGGQVLLETLPSWGFSKAQIEQIAALVGCSGSGGVYSEELITNPEKAVARAREITHLPLTFLDDPAERRAFAEALVCVKLGDASRGQYGSTIDELKRSSMARSAKRTQWIAAVDAKRGVASGIQHTVDSFGTP